MKKKLALMMAVTLTMGSLLTGCGSSDDAAQTTTDTEAATEETTDDAATEETQDAAQESSEDTQIVYAVEAGSAGEEVAQEKGFQVNSVASQADALMEVASGTSDAAIIDLLYKFAIVLVAKLVGQRNFKLTICSGIYTLVQIGARKKGRRTYSPAR